MKLVTILLALFAFISSAFTAESLARLRTDQAQLAKAVSKLAAAVGNNADSIGKLVNANMQNADSISQLASASDHNSNAISSVIRALSPARRPTLDQTSTGDCSPNISGSGNVTTAECSSGKGK